MARVILLNVYVHVYILSNDWWYKISGGGGGGALKPEQIVGKDGPISGLAMRVLFTGVPGEFTIETLAMRKL